MSGAIGAFVGGETAQDGTEIHCALPGDFHTKNVGGSDGAGLCVYCSMRHAGVWHDESVFAAMFDYMKQFPGGGYPAKVDKMVVKYCQEKGLPKPDYIHVEDSDLDILKSACQTGHLVMTTYSFSPTGRYRGQRIAHMVNLVHADDRHFVILDNNYMPKDPANPDNYEWLTPEEFRRVSSQGGGNYWAMILLKPGAPLPPKNPKE